MFEFLYDCVKSICFWKPSANCVNYRCPECMKQTKAVPNIDGRFFIINESQCRCNGCGGVFKTSDYFADAGADQQIA